MPVNEFNEVKDLEVMTFRRNMLSVCLKSVEERSSHGLHGQARYVYPPDIHSSSELPPHIKERVDNGTLNQSSVLGVIEQFCREQRHFRN